METIGIETEEKKTVDGVVVATLVCQRCGRKWQPRPAVGRRLCPKCHSPNWDLPIEKKEE